MYVVKTKALIICMVVAQLIYAFVFAMFSYDAAHIILSHSIHIHCNYSP